MKVMGVVQSKLAPAAQKCFVLAHNQGYANLSTVHYLAVKNTANKGACCSLCQRDSRCVAWTRVAGEACQNAQSAVTAMFQSSKEHTIHPHRRPACCAQGNWGLQADRT